GKTTVLLATIAAATRRQESCALIDASDSFDPSSGTAAGLNFNKLLWVRCRKSLSAIDPSPVVGRWSMANPKNPSPTIDDHKRWRKNHERRLDQVLKSTDL